MRSESVDGKKQIYYARTYRRLQIDRSPGMVVALLVIMTALIVFVRNIGRLTGAMAGIAVRILSGAVQAEVLQVRQTDYSILGTITYLVLPAADVSRRAILINILVGVGVLMLMRLLRRTGTPLAIFAFFAVLTHMVSCVFFQFAGAHFPYTLGQYSELYVKQQVGIWLVFFVLSGLMITLIGERDYFFKSVMFVSVMCYSFVFGVVRYILFLYLLHVGSLLYMAILFFVFGPMFDFAYLVAFYAVFMNKKTNDYEYGKKRSAWKWS